MKLEQHLNKNENKQTTYSIMQINLASANEYRASIECNKRKKLHVRMWDESHKDVDRAVRNAMQNGEEKNRPRKKNAFQPVGQANPVLFFSLERKRKKIVFNAQRSLSNAKMPFNMQ